MMLLPGIGILLITYLLSYLCDMGYTVQGHGSLLQPRKHPLVYVYRLQFIYFIRLHFMNNLIVQIRLDQIRFDSICIAPISTIQKQWGSTVQHSGANQPIAGPQALYSVARIWLVLCLQFIPFEHQCIYDNHVRIDYKNVRIVVCDMYGCTDVSVNNCNTASCS